MLLRLILAVIIISLLIAAIPHIRKQPPEKRSKLSIKFILYTIIAGIILLVVTGKLHWIAAAIAALLPIMQKMIFLGLRFLPFLNQFRSARAQQQHNQQQSTTNNSGKMTVEQAKDIFGIQTIESIEQITKRHRELMQKNHPDRGGSDYLAAQLNEAKDVLIEHIKRTSG